MGWKKNKDGGTTFNYSDIALCKECGGYGICEDYKNDNPCDIIEFSIGNSSLSASLYSKERSNPDTTSCVELNFSKTKKEDILRIAENIDSVIESNPDFKECEEIQGLSECFTASIREKLPDKERFELVYHKGDIQKLSYVFFDRSFFLSFLRNIPIVKNGQNPTHDDLDFPFRTVKRREFSDAYESLYKQLVDFAVKNCKSVD